MEIKLNKECVCVCDGKRGYARTWIKLINGAVKLTRGSLSFFPPADHCRACFSSCNNNSARQLPAATGSSYPVAVISFGESHVRDIQVSLRNRRKNKTVKGLRGAVHACALAAMTSPEPSREECEKTLWRNGNGQSEISKCHKSGFDGFLFACSGREKEKRGNPGAVEKKEKRGGMGGARFLRKHDFICSWQRQQMRCCEAWEATVLTGCQRSPQCFLSPAHPPPLHPSLPPTPPRWPSIQEPLRQTGFHLLGPLHLGVTSHQRWPCCVFLLLQKTQLQKQAAGLKWMKQEVCWRSSTRLSDGSLMQKLCNHLRAERVTI